MTPMVISGVLVHVVLVHVLTDKGRKEGGWGWGGAKEGQEKRDKGGKTSEESKGSWRGSRVQLWPILVV